MMAVKYSSLYYMFAGDKNNFQQESISFFYRSIVIP